MVRARLADRDGAGRAAGGPGVKDAHRTEAAAATLRSLGVRSQRALQRLLAKVGLVPEAAGHLEASASVQALGRFRVLVEGAPVSPSVWQSRKARDLLKILVARRGRPVPRDELMDLLWPDEPPDKVANRLSVALSTLRAVLDPEKRAPSDHYVVSTRDACRLDIDHVEVDVERFLARAARAWTEPAPTSPAPSKLLSQAESAYTGEFLEENAYDDWAVGLREEARGAYLLICRALAANAGSAGDFAAAARYLRRLLERDPYDERAHLDLVGALVSGGQHGESHRCYRAYSSRMREIGVEPAPFSPLLPEPDGASGPSRPRPRRGRARAGARGSAPTRYVKRGRGGMSLSPAPAHGRRTPPLGWPEQSHRTPSRADRRAPAWWRRKCPAAPAR